MAHSRTTRSKAAKGHRGKLRAAAAALALLTGIAPAAADMRFDRHGYERTEYRKETHTVETRTTYRGAAPAPVARVRHPARGTPIARPHRGGDDGMAIALGVIGFAAGAIVGSSLDQPRYGHQRAYAPRYSEPRPAPLPRPVPRSRDYGAGDFPPPPVAPVPMRAERPYRPARAGNPFQPWTAAWLDACERRYRSFNPSTGTFRGYDGRDHFCTGPRQ